MQNNNGMAKGIVVCNTTLCLNCGNCIVACKRRHKDISRHRREGATLIGISLFPNLCSLCQDAKCIEACNRNGLERDDDGYIIVTDKCVGCGSCARACPYNAILLFSKQEGIGSFFGDFFSYIKCLRKKMDVAL